MKKFTFIFCLCLGIGALTSCTTKEEVDPRDVFVGIYSLNVTSDVKTTNGNKTVEYPMDAYNKSFIITLNQENKSKVNYSGYYGEGTATISGSTLQFDEPKISVSNYSDGVYLQIDFENMPISRKNNLLEWQTVVAGGAVSINGGTSNAIAIAGVLNNIATKK